MALSLAAMTWPAVPVAQAFPVEIEHRFGITVVPDEPTRIVSVSFIGHDFLLALGIVPHGLRHWYGPHPYGVWPWAQEALGDAEPTVLRGEIDVERIALLKPDLIVGQWSGMTERDYRLLSRIAPTIAPRAGDGDYGTPWQVMLRTLGRATGRAAEADAIIARLERRFADVRAAHPEWQGATAVMVWAGQVGAFTEGDLRGQFLTSLGFKVPEAVNRRGSAEQFYVLIPDEDLSDIDADALIWLDAGGSAALLNRLPLRPTLRAVREGREIYADPTLSAALSHSSPQSLAFALDELVPLLEAALDGDPSTEVSSSRDAGILPGDE